MNKSKDTDYIEKTFRSNSWKHFQIHADHRLRAFQFYITISTALLGAGLLTSRFSESAPIIITIGLFVAFFSFIFWRLDKRTRTLVQNAERAIKFLDNQYELEDIDGAPHPLKLFERDDQIMQEGFRKRILSGQFSYSDCLGLVFVIIGSVGLFSALLAICEIT